MPVNNALKNLAADGRFSLADANTLKQLVQQGQVTPDEAKETLQRYGDVMDPEASQLISSFTGGTRAAATSQLPASTLTKTLAPGQNSEDVKTLQHGLMTLGMREQNQSLTLPSGADGKYGKETSAAVTAFQTAHHIAPTGTADPNTLRAIDAALRVGPNAPPQRTPTTAATSTTPSGPSATAPRPTRGLGTPPAGSRWNDVAKAGDQSITAREKAQNDGVDNGGLGAVYGDHSDFADAVHAGNKAAVAQQVSDMSNGQWKLKSMTIGSVTVEDASGATKTLHESSCIGFVMDNVKQAYLAAGKGDRFAQIQQRMKDTHMMGTVLCEELQKDGWSAIFYSPRTAADLKQSGETEKLAALNMAQRGSRIWKEGGVNDSLGIKPDAVVTGYRDSQPDAKTDAALRQLERAPFLVGVANGGVHTMVAHNGNVAEMHWKAAPNDKDAIQEHAIRDWEWDTGLYMVPPGGWTTPRVSPGTSPNA